MIEAYAFLAMFMAQILAMSVLYPAWLARRIRMKTAGYPAELHTQLQPSVERSLTLYRALNTGIAILGLLPLGWFISYTQRPDWDDGPIEALVGVYFSVQMLPVLCIAWMGVRHNKMLRTLARPIRKATLQRRGLFDFVSPFIVLLAVLAYFLYAAYLIYIERHPFPGFAGVFVNIGGATLIYALVAFVAYMTLYGRRPPFETHEDRVESIGLVVRICVYTCIIHVVFMSLNFTLVLLDLQRWEPFAESVSFVITILLCSRGLTAPPRRPEMEGLGSSPAS